MSEDKKVTVELTVYQAAAVREALFRSTAQDSYVISFRKNYAGQRSNRAS